MSKLNGHFERGHGHVPCRLRASGHGPRSHDGGPDGRAGQPVVCGVHGDADTGRGRQNRIEFAISGHDCPIGPADAARGVAAGKIARIVRPAVDEA